MIAVFLSPLYFFMTWFLAHEFMKWLASVCGWELYLSKKRRASDESFVRAGGVPISKKFFYKIEQDGGIVYGWHMRIPIYTLLIVASLMIPVGFFLPASNFKFSFLHFGSMYLGFMIYAGPLCMLNELIQLIIRNRIGSKMRRYIKISGIICILIPLIIGTYGRINAEHIRMTSYEADIKGFTAESGMKIALVSDLHLGYNIGMEMMVDMVEKINTLDADLVVIAGDIFDNDYDALDDPEGLIKTLSEIKSRYGVYACYGNHDVKEKILSGFTFDYNEKKVSDERMDIFLERAGIKLLRDETVLIDNRFYLCGRADYKKPGKDIDVRATANELLEGLDRSLPVIVIDHQPKNIEIKRLSEAHADLVLSGHTHAGQFFPLNILGELVHTNNYGMKKIGDMVDIVTSGVGLYGPDMRVGTISEICEINIQ